MDGGMCVVFLPGHHMRSRRMLTFTVGREEERRLQGSVRGGCAFGAGGQASNEGRTWRADLPNFCRPRTRGLCRPSASAAASAVAIARRRDVAWTTSHRH